MDAGARALAKRHAVLGGHDDQRVVEDVQLAKGIHQPANVPVQTRHRLVVAGGFETSATVVLVVFLRRVPGRVRRIVGLIEKEGPIGVLLDEFDAPVGLDVGPVGRLVRLADPVKHLRIKRSPGVEKSRIRRPQMPLADVRGLVTGIVQKVGEIIPEVEAVIVEGVGIASVVGVAAAAMGGVAIFSHPVGMRILAGQYGRPARSAQRLGRVVGVESNPVAGQRVDIGRVNGLHAVGAEGVPAALVKEHEDDVGRPLRRWRLAGRGRAKRQRGPRHAREKRSALHSPSALDSVFRPRELLRVGDRASPGWARFPRS